MSPSRSKKFTRFLLQYFSIGILVGAGLMLVQIFYFDRVDEENRQFLTELFGESQGILEDLDEVLFPTLGRTALELFGRKVILDSECLVSNSRPVRVTCLRSPEMFSVAFLELDAWKDQREAWVRVSVEGEIERRTSGDFVVDRYTTDQFVLRRMQDRDRPEVQPELPDEVTGLSPLTHTFNAVICDQQQCVKADASSRQMLEGFIGQLLWPDEEE